MGLLETYDSAIHHTCRAGQAVLERDRYATLVASQRAQTALANLAGALDKQPASDARHAFLQAIADMMSTLDTSADVENVTGIEEVLSGLNELRQICRSALERRSFVPSEAENAA